MVFFPKLFSAAALLAIAISGVAADLVITNPSSSAWWVAKSQNLISWTCHDTSIADFTVLVGNTSPTISVAPIAIIAIQQNYQCSIIVTQDQANQAVGTGWQVVFANPLNNTDVYATSQPFEIKPLGSLYPSQVTPSPILSGGASGTGSGAAASATTKSGAAALVPKSVWSVLGAGVGALALVAGFA